MLPLILEHLTFRSENRFQPVIEALAVMKQYLGTRGRTSLRKRQSARTAS